MNFKKNLYLFGIYFFLKILMERKKKCILLILEDLSAAKIPAWDWKRVIIDGLSTYATTVIAPWP